MRSDKFEKDLFKTIFYEVVVKQANAEHYKDIICKICLFQTLEFPKKKAEKNPVDI